MGTDDELDPQADDLRELFAAAFVDGMPGDDCPEPELLFDAFHKQIPVEQRLAIVDHVAQCPVCADAWRLASRTDVPTPRRG